MMSEAELVLGGLMTPRSSKAAAEFDFSSERLVHYTTAENALKILRSKRLWLRNARMMNDFSEVTYGRDCLLRQMQNGRFNQFRAFLDVIHPSLLADVNQLFGQTLTRFEEQTFLTSLSKMSTPVNDGILSMWRAYGGPIAGAAIVFNPEVLRSGVGHRLQTFTTVVHYDGEAGLGAELDDLLQGLYANSCAVHNVSSAVLKHILLRALWFLILSTKHNAFREEQEWRLVHQPTFYPSQDIIRSVECVRGLPQLIYQVPLEDVDGTLPELITTKLIDKVIIGPSAYPRQVSQAFEEVLRSLGFSDPERRVVIADIPLRQQA